MLLAEYPQDVERQPITALAATDEPPPPKHPSNISDRLTASSVGARSRVQRTFRAFHASRGRPMANDLRIVPCLQLIRLRTLCKPVAGPQLP